MVGVTLDDGTVNQLLELDVSQVSSHHHFQDSEKLSIGNEAVVIHIVDLESETQLLFARCSSGQGVEAMDELEEGDATILVLI